LKPGEQPGLFDNPLQRARELKAKREYKGAMEILQAELKRHPDNLKAKASLADLYYRTERHREALRLAGEILRDDPDDPRALVVTGNVLLARRKPAEALEQFRLALKIAETDYLWMRCARCHLDMKQHQDALEAVRQADRLNPDDTEVLRLWLETARQARDRPEEREVLRRAARSAPDDPEQFAAFVLPLLADLPHPEALRASEELRETRGQEINPSLLAFEIEAALEAGEVERAASRLKPLLSQELGTKLDEQAGLLAQRIESLGGETGDKT
jgi:tetratricopeptide (TPR) repeat protein